MGYGQKHRCLLGPEVPNLLELKLQVAMSFWTWETKLGPFEEQAIPAHDHYLSSSKTSPSGLIRRVEKKLTEPSYENKPIC